MEKETEWSCWWRTWRAARLRGEKREGLLPEGRLEKAERGGRDGEVGGREGGEAIADLLMIFEVK